MTVCFFHGKAAFPMKKKASAIEICIFRRTSSLVRLILET
ncbi:hypothetical protein HMPREF3038_02545 [Akkermansia sp. KLE1797]|nr:hypothetical protein HMPREF3038_02545 [Akkermansia sp. KLE1797]